MRPGRAAGATVATVLLLAGCTSSTEPDEQDAAPSSSPSSSADPPPAAEDEGSCPAERAAPADDRPVVDLDLRLADDLRTVTGTETVVFTPDLATDELVFRLVPNAPDTAAAGNRLEVDEVRGEDVVGGEYVDAGAGGPGGLYVVELDDRLSVGESTEVELDFTLTVGDGSFDRVGYAEDVTWWASGAPLLAWESGVGWARDPFVELGGETAASPTADTTVRVSAPEDLTVLMTGAQTLPSAARDGRRTWTSREPLARDVAVAAGEFSTAQRTTAGGVRVTTGVLPGAELSAGELAEWSVEAVEDLAERFGDFPYRTLSVPLLPDYGGAIEYPSLILQGSPGRPLLVHEVAHMWFYGMVGNSQFRDPWLDEAFATYAEALDDARPESLLERTLAEEGEVGASMAELEPLGNAAYFDIVYGKGGAALRAAREAVGAQAFDEALRCYVRANAWRIATPADLAEALAHLPEALDVLRRAGALGEADVPR